MARAVWKARRRPAYKHHVVRVRIRARLVFDAERNMLKMEATRGVGRRGVQVTYQRRADAPMAMRRRECEWKAEGRGRIGGKAGLREGLMGRVSRALSFGALEPADGGPDLAGFRWGRTRGTARERKGARAAHSVLSFSCRSPALRLGNARSRWLLAALLHGSSNPDGMISKRWLGR